MLRTPPGKPLAKSERRLCITTAARRDPTWRGRLQFRYFPMYSDRVLIVDQSAESREVLSALLARTGRSSIEASRAAEALLLVRQLQPQLIVLDADSDSSSERLAIRELTAAARRTNTPIVLLGKITGAEIAFDPSELLAKPYHYGQLIRRIESVLEQRRAAAA